MNRHSTGSKKFNFNDIDQQSQEVMPLQKLKQKKSKRSYNFSLIDDSDDDQPQSYIKKSCKVAPQIQKDASIRETAQEEGCEESSRVNQAIGREKKMQQQERDKKFTEQLLTAIINLDQQRLLNNLLQQAKQKKLNLSQNNVLLFLLLNESFQNPCSFCVEENYTGVIASKTPIMVDELNSLRKWAVYSLRTLGEEVDKIVQKRKAPKRLGKLAEHRIKELAEEFESAHNYEDCLAVCSIEDMAFRDSYEFSSSKEMRNQLSIISSGTLKAIPHTAWLVDLSLALLYFDPLPLQDLMKDLNKKYAKSIHPFLTPHFLLLSLMKGSLLPMKDTIFQIVANSPKQLDQLNQILYMWTLNSHRTRAADTFEKTVQNIIKLIRSPPLFVDFLCYLRLDAAKVKSYFNFFLGQNVSLSSNRDEGMEQLKSYITKRDSESTKRSDNLTMQILLKWVKCESFLQQGDKIESLRYLVANFQLLSSPVIHNSSDIYQTMIDSLLTFELVCTYKASQKRQFSQVLNDLAELLQGDKEKRIINGIIAFLQFKGKVDWSSKQQKMADFFYVFWVLEDRVNGGDESSKKIKASMIKALSNFLESSQGELYLHRLSSPYSSSQSMALAKFLDSSQLLEVEAEEKALILKSPFISLACMLKTVPKLTRKMAAILLL